MIIYKITNTINGKIYIGQTRQVKPIERFNRHVRESKGPTTNYFHSAIRKYGKINFVFDIICCCKTLDDLNYMETYFIKHFNSTNKEFGYNLTTGGDSTEVNLESVKKMQEVIKKQYENGRSPWNKGLKYKATSESWNKGLMGYKLNHGYNVSKALTGLKKTEDHRKNLSIAAFNRFLKTKHIQSKNVICLELNIVFKSASQAARYFNTSQGCISNICRGERKSLSGRSFQYTDVEPTFIMLGAQ